MNKAAFRQKAAKEALPLAGFLDQTEAEESKNNEGEGPVSDTEFGINQYMQEVKAIPRLSHDQTMALFRFLNEKQRSIEQSRASTNHPPDQQVNETELALEIVDIEKRLVTHNLRLVVYLAHRYQGRGIALQDLIQEGNIGLMQAVKKFDHSLGYRFSTYATYWIRQAMLKAIYEHGRSIRIPIYIFEKLRRFDHEAKTNHGHTVATKQKPNGPHTNEKTTRDVPLLKELMKDPLPLDSCSINDGLDALEFIPDENQLSPEERAVVEDLSLKLRTAMAGLTPREEIILRLRYGVESPCSHTLEEVGRTFKLTKERIRQIESKALCQLHESMSPPHSALGSGGMGKSAEQCEALFGG
jgi:RNA polymerase sigma factor (sigma-70 family)